MERQLQGLADTQLKMETSASLTEAFAEEVDKVRVSRTLLHI